MKTGRKFIALLTVFMMVFGSLPAIAVADAAHPYVYTNHTQNSGSVHDANGNHNTAQIQLRQENTDNYFYTYCADLSHSLISGEHYSIAALTDGNIRAIVNADVGSIISSLGLSMNSSERTEAVQAAIWHFSNGLNLTTSDNDADVLTLYNYLIGLPSAGAGGVPTQATATLELTDAAYDTASDRVSLTFRFKSSDNSVTLTPSVTNGTVGSVTTNGGWSYVTITNINRQNSFTITVSGSQTLSYGASLFIPESADNGGSMGQKLVGNPGSMNVTVSASFSTSFGGVQIKKDFTHNSTTADKGQTFTVRITGGPNNTVTRDVSVPGDGSTVSVYGLPFGTYTASEILSSGQTGKYSTFEIENSDTHDNTININDTRYNHNGTVTVTNEQLGSITINKSLTPHDSTSSFTFTITGPGFPAGGENFTLKDGGSKLYSGLSYGTYTITEQAQTGYALTSYSGDGTTNGSSRKVVIDDTHRTLSFTANNEKRGAIAIIKIDSVTGGPVSGVTFHITGPSGYNQTRTTDANGRIDLNNLVAGNYSVTETDAPDGYRINNTSAVTKNVALGSTVQFDFSDDPIGKLNLIKKDMSGNPLNGAIFWVSTSASFGTYTVYDTGTNSSITTGWLNAGTTYYVKEVKAPDGYVIPADNVKQVVVVRNATTPVTFNDPKDEGSLLIRKTSSYQNQPVAGAIFQVSRNSTFTDLVSLPNGGMTDANGELLVQHLPSRQYWVRETAAAPGYDFDIAVVRNVTVSYNDTANANFTNHPQARVRIVKTDASSGSALAGAVFGVYSDPECTALVDTLAATDANGYALSKWLPFSTGTIYYVKEISAPSRYSKDTAVKQAVFTSAGQTLDVSFANNRLFGDLSVSKALESFTGDTQTFTFTITGPSYPNGYEFTLGNGGSKDFDDIDFGTYTITETVSLPYALIGFAGGDGTRDGNSYTVVLGSENKGFTVTATNRRLGSITIGKALQEGITGDTTDFSFTISGPTGFTADTFTLKAGQTKAYENVPYGDYTITELAPPTGYGFDSFTGDAGTANGASYTVHVGTAKQDISFTANNVKLGRLEVVKTERGSNPPVYLAGAVFGIYSDSNASNLVATMTATDANGHAVSGWLVPGTYYVKELSAPDGYVIDSTTPVSATVSAGETVLLPNFTDTKNVGWIVVTKLDRQAGDPVGGVTFQLMDKDPAQHSDFTVLQEKITGSDGKVTFNDLTPGTVYYVRESHQAPGYTIDILDVRAVTVLLGQGVPLEFQNDGVGKIGIVKTDGHGTYLGGAEFQVSANESDFSQAFTLTTAADGTVTSDELVVGTWYVKETKAPDGYMIDDSSVQAVTVVRNETAQVTFTDTRLVGRIKVTKTDSNESNNPHYLSGAEFAISTASGEGFDAGIVDTLTTDSNGVATSDWLPLGTYWVKETKAPDGYVIDNANPVKVEVTTHNTEYGVSFTDTKYEGWIIVHKISRMTEAPVQGVTFELLDMNPSDSGFSSEHILATAVTDANGVATFLHLVPGNTYWVRETIPAPGYDIDPNNAQSVTVVFNEGSNLYFANSPVGYVRVTKVDAADEGLKLPGAVYEIYKAEQAPTADAADPVLVGTITTGEDGTALSDWLPYTYGTTYIVKEKTPPVGYLLSAEEQTVTFSEPGQIVDVTFHNVRNVGSLIVMKVDALNPDKPLAGAQFKLFTDEAGLHQVGPTATTGASGIARFDNLTPGEYWLRETKAPTNYELLPDPIPVTVTAGVTQPDPIVIENQYNPPEDIQTGMMDWNILIISGLALLAGVMLVLFARKRRSAAHK